MINRITVTLEQPEYSALLTLATQELRSPPDQLRYILRRALEHSGLLPPTDDPAPRPQQESPHDPH